MLSFVLQRARLALALVGDDDHDDHDDDDGVDYAEKFIFFLLAFLLSIFFCLLSNKFFRYFFSFRVSRFNPLKKKKEKFN